MNIEMFLTAKEVEESLERRETATCLAWCHDNKSRLRKMKVCELSGLGLVGMDGSLLEEAEVGWKQCYLPRTTMASPAVVFWVGFSL